MPQLKEVKAKAKRRGNNEGSIFQRKDGRWSGSVTTGYKTDGKPMRKTVYGNTRQDVAKKVAALSAQVFESGYSIVSAKNNQDFETLMREWYDLFEAPNIADVTNEKYRSMLKKHIFPAFGTLDVKDVDTKRLQRFFNEKKKVNVKGRVGYSSDYINKMKNLLNNFFKYAMKQHYVVTNPILDIEIKALSSSNSNDNQRQALRPEIRSAVLKWVEENQLLKPILITCKLTGLRPQELITLKWADVNLDTKMLNVRTALNRVVEFDDDWNIVSRGAKMGKTKTPKSVRIITLPSAVVDALYDWKDYCSLNDINSEFVFPNTRTGGMRTYGGLRSLFRRFIERHGLQEEGMTLYTLRHTFATILLEQRENPKIVMQLMGHSKIKTTLDQYSHVVDDSVFEGTAKTLDNVYAGLTLAKA